MVICLPLLSLLPPLLLPSSLLPCFLVAIMSHTLTCPLCSHHEVSPCHRPKWNKFNWSPTGRLWTMSQLSLSYSELSCLVHCILATKSWLANTNNQSSNSNNIDIHLFLHFRKKWNHTMCAFLQFSFFYSAWHFGSSSISSQQYFIFHCWIIIHSMTFTKVRLHSFLLVSLWVVFTLRLGKNQTSSPSFRGHHLSLAQEWFCLWNPPWLSWISILKQCYF